jgi:hypothetical protein
MQKLAERTANFILRILRHSLQFPWCQKMLAGFELPTSVDHHAHYRVWQRGGYDLNIWSEKKRLEKLNYMHNNPVKRGLVAQPGDWPWSSWRFCYLEDRSVLAMDSVPWAQGERPGWGRIHEEQCMRHPRPQGAAEAPTLSDPWREVRVSAGSQRRL